MFQRVVITFKQISYRSFSTPLGFVGLGVGMTFVQNLIKAGSKVTVYDLKKNLVDAAVQAGATGASSAGEVAANSDILFTLLPDFRAVLHAVGGPKGILKNAKTDLLYVDLSTIGPVNAHRLLLGMNEEKKIQFLSAPISGSNRLGPSSRIKFLVGGNKDHLQKVDKYLKVMADVESDYATYVGPDIGDGQAARICNLLLACSTMVAVAEVMNLGRKLGINTQILVEILNATSAQCWACEKHNPVPGISKDAPANRNYANGHQMRYVYRSLIVAQDVAAKLKAPIPTLASAVQMYSLGLAKGLGTKDFSSVIKVYKDTLIGE